MKKLRKTEDELKKRIAYKKERVFFRFFSERVKINQYMAKWWE